MGKHDKTRSEVMPEWEAKGTKWLAEQLWSAKKATERAKENARSYERAYHKELAKDREVYALRDANRLMATVLRDNGIKPTRLRVTYIDCDCLNCPGYGGEDGEWDCLGCGETYNGETIRQTEAKFIESIGFYTYRIRGNEMEGINAVFEKKEYEVIKVVDEKTGEVIYQNDLYTETAGLDGAVADESAPAD